MPCRKWRVEYTSAFEKQARRYGVWRRALRVLEGFGSLLEERGERVLRGLPVTHYTRVGGKTIALRRLKAGRLRLFLWVDWGGCRVVFTHVEPRTSRTYKRRRF